MTSRASSQTLTDHDEIRRWAEERGARPACVRNTGGGEDVGMIRLDFPGYSGADSLEEIEWDDWFEKFDDNNLALIVQNQTARGQKSNFNKLVSRGTAEQGSGQRRASARHGARRGTSAGARASARGSQASARAGRASAGTGRASVRGRKTEARSRTTRSSGRSSRSASAPKATKRTSSGRGSGSRSARRGRGSRVTSISSARSRSQGKRSRGNNRNSQSRRRAA